MTQVFLELHSNIFQDFPQFLPNLFNVFQDVDNAERRIGKDAKQTEKIPKTLFSNYQSLNLPFPSSVSMLCFSQLSTCSLTE